jgi:hypothetical protein
MYGYRRYSWSDRAELLQALAAQRRPQPVPRPWLNPYSVTRWTVLLRGIGRLLDSTGTSAWVIDAAVGDTPEASTARARAAGGKVIELVALAEECR